MNNKQEPPEPLRAATGSASETVRREHAIMVGRSLALQKLLRDAGYVKGSGVSTEGQILVSKIAKKHGLRNWSDTRTVDDYDRLLLVTREHLTPNDIA